MEENQITLPTEVNGFLNNRELNKITLAKHHSFPRAAKCKISFFLILGGSGE